MDYLPTLLIIASSGHSWPARGTDRLAVIHRRGEFAPGPRQKPSMEEFRLSLTPLTPWSHNRGDSTLLSSPTPIPAFTQVPLPLFVLSPCDHKISPAQLSCELGLGCKHNQTGGSPCVSIAWLKEGRPSVSEVPAQQGNLTQYQKIQ